MNQLFNKLCLRHTELSRQWKLSDLQIGSKYTAIMVVTNVPVHLEFIIRNFLHCLSDQWSMIIYTSQQSYRTISDLCQTIHSNIQIEQINLSEKITIDQYSELLMSVDFWEKLPTEKILIFQPDTIILKTNLDEFIDYDYIGAPWPPVCQISPNNIGNGGLSLRSKSKMLELLTKFYYLNVDIPTVTQNMMLSRKMQIIPEDVFFSRQIHLLDNVNLPTQEIANQFASEQVFNRNSTGYHQIWMATPNWITWLEKRLARL